MKIEEIEFEEFKKYVEFTTSSNNVLETINKQKNLYSLIKDEHNIAIIQQNNRLNKSRYINNSYALTIRESLDVDNSNIFKVCHNSLYLTILYNQQCSRKKLEKGFWFFVRFPFEAFFIYKRSYFLSNFEEKSKYERSKFRLSFPNSLTEVDESESDFLTSPQLIDIFPYCFPELNLETFVKYFLDKS